MKDRDLVAWIIDRHEGHTFTDHPKDRGGATKFGVTWRVFNAYMGREMPIEALKELKKDLAIDILYSEFCFKPRLSMLHDERLKLCAVDCSIHSGPARAVRSLQYAVFPGPPYDGDLGPITRNAILRADPAEVHRDMLAYRLRFLAKIVARDKSQSVFTGWWNRVANLIELPAAL